MVVLHQHDRVLAARLLDHRIGEALVDLAVLLPVGFAEHRPHMGDMTQRPHAFVGETVVVALLLLVGHPDAAQQVVRRSAGYTQPILRVHDFGVGIAAAVGDPSPRTGPHHRLHGCHEAAGRSPDDHALRARSWI